MFSYTLLKIHVQRGSIGLVTDFNILCQLARFLSGHLNTLYKVAEEGYLKLPNSQGRSADVLTSACPCRLGGFQSWFCTQRQYLAVLFVRITFLNAQASELAVTRDVEIFTKR